MNDEATKERRQSTPEQKVKNVAEAPLRAVRANAPLPRVRRPLWPQVPPDRGS